MAVYRKDWNNKSYRLRMGREHIQEFRTNANYDTKCVPDNFSTWKE